MIKSISAEYLSPGDEFSFADGFKADGEPKEIVDFGSGVAIIRPGRSRCSLKRSGFCTCSARARW